MIQTHDPRARRSRVRGRRRPRRWSAHARRLGLGGWLAIGWLVLVVAVAVLAPVLPLDDPNENFAEIAGQGPGTAGHILGGDGLGRDMLSRVVWGARASLLLGVGAIAGGPGRSAACSA